MLNPACANRTSWILALATGVALAGCSGSGSSGSSSSAVFSLTATSVTSNQVWQINRPIEFTFSQPIDFDTVNSNTINIQELGGAPAVGEFRSGPLDVNGMTRTVIFQPVCPTEDDFSDSGFRPDGIEYQIDLPDVETGTGTVLAHPSVGGQALAVGMTLTFRTPTTAVLSELFLDTVPGPPTPLLSPGSETTCRLLVGDPDSPMQVVPFILDPVTGTGNLEDGFLAPNNLYSALETQVTVVLEFNQPVSPTAANISSSRMFLLYEETRGSGTWILIPTELDLVANCSESGSTVIMSPVGILPQDRPLRVVVAAQFEDMVGDRNTLPLTNFAQMETRVLTDDAGESVEGADEFLEPFAYDDNDFEDTSAALDAPRGSWGDAATETGGLRATFAFDGTGGPGGEFDLVITPNTNFVFDTTSTLIFGGPGGVPQYSQLAVGGRLDVRNLFIPESSSIRIQGPNPAVILASGDVVVEGTISADGSNAVPVFTLDTPQQPEPGASGQGGGGNGGTASYLTNVVTPRGGNGFGAYQAPNLGGEGGESGWNPSTANSGENRRPGGGGGGRLGHDQLMSYSFGGEDDICPSERMYGLNAESGFVGVDTAFSAFDPSRIPYGGHTGPQVFSTLGGADDDFLGTKRKNFDTVDEVLIIGELLAPQPGTGGGAGGDATRCESYPPPTLISVNQDKGAGGGGGAGALSIRALGDIVIGPSGKITAIGGHGSGGENTAWVNRVGGGSGGGSGGHIILETAQKIYINSTGPETNNWRALNVRGGQGGVGAGDVGGANDSETTQPKQDAKHVGFPTPAGLAASHKDNPWIPTLSAVCLEYNNDVLNTTTTGQKYIIRIAGGDGGPGIIQLHVGNLSGVDPDIVYDFGSGNLFNACWPAPLGYDADNGAWVDQLLPTFGRFSKSQSSWIPLGAAAVAPGTDVLTSLTYLFDGTNPADGLVNTTSGIVDSLDPLLSAAELHPETSASYPRFNAPASVLFDPATLAGGDEIYARNPNLLRRFRLTVGGQNYSVESAETVELEGGELALKVTVSEALINPATGAVSLIPRYFTVATNGVEDSLPNSASIKVEFQATTAGGLGDPDEAEVFPAPIVWATDINDLTDEAANTDFRFIRYRVTFDINVGGVDELSFNTPLPMLDFLRMPFKF